MSVHDDDKYQAGPPPDGAGVPVAVVVSPDVNRDNRVPPGQSRTRKWPVLQFGEVPQVDPHTWTLTIRGEVDRPYTITWQQFQTFPRVTVLADFHCVTRWSRLGNLWEGVSLAVLLLNAGIKPSATHLIAVGADGGWSTNMPLSAAMQPDVLVADTHDGELLNADHGAPARLIVPRLFAWKSAKWLLEIVLLNHDERGTWEQAGYHDHGDPWVVSDQHPDGERFQTGIDDARASATL